VGGGAVIVLDTHVWIWWVQGDPRLRHQDVERIEQAEATGLGVSAISCWEVAKLIERGRLALPLPVEDWLTTALSYPGVELLPLSPRIAVESTQLPGEFHQDPADQIIVATARVHTCPLMTADQKIRAYPHVTVLAVA
jgi:PIN domain nuclease of toxin-antitoxin system